MKQILIADDHEVVRSGLRAILETHSGWEVVAEADNGKDAVSRTLMSRPDIAIVDYSMPLMSGVEVARQIKAHHLTTEVLLFTMHDSDTLFKEAFEAGARAYLLKSDAKRFLMAAVESLIVHRPFYCGTHSERALNGYFGKNGTPAVRSLLSPREKNVVQLIAEGHSNKSMSSILNLSVKTIETHRAAAMRKLEVTSTAGLVRYAVRSNLVEL